MSFAAGVYAGIRTGGGGSGSGGNDGQRRLFGLKKFDNKDGGGGTGGGAGSGGREPKESVGAQSAPGGQIGSGQAAGSTSGANATTGGCVSGSRKACAALMFHALASVPLSRNKQEEGDERDAKTDG
jgi:hypothetical protein